MSTIVERIERQAGVPDLAAVLAQRLGGAELTSLLLAVFHERASGLGPAQVLRGYERDAFVEPTPVDARLLHRFDAAAFASASAFEAMELAPLCPLGTCSAVGWVDQNNVVGAIRGGEVVSDPTNVMALECAVRRRKRPSELVRLCASHHAVRGQRFDGPGLSQHFRLFGLCTAGRDRGTGVFEADALIEHLDVHLGLLAKLRDGGFPIGTARVRLERDIPETARARLVADLRERWPEVTVAEVDPRPGAYYGGGAFELSVTPAAGGDWLSICDGGFVDWTAKLLSNRKERLLISAMGSQRVCQELAPG